MMFLHASFPTLVHLPWIFADLCILSLLLIQAIVCILWHSPPRMLPATQCCECEAFQEKGKGLIPGVFIHSAKWRILLGQVKDLAHTKDMSAEDVRLEKVHRMVNKLGEGEWRHRMELD